MKEFYAKYLPEVGAKPFKVKYSPKRNKDMMLCRFLHTKKGWCIYLGNGKAIKARLFLCSTKYKKGDYVLEHLFNEKTNSFNTVKLIKSKRSDTKDKSLKDWATNQGGVVFREEYSGIMHFKVIAQISQYAIWVKEYTLYNKENCFFDESDIRIMGEYRGAHDDGSYNLCLIKCPTCKNFH